MSELYRIAQAIRNFEGIHKKQRINQALSPFISQFPQDNDVFGRGDDAGGILHGEGYLLLASDGIGEQAIIDSPRNAGRSAVIINVNDISAMGGRPLGFTHVLSCSDQAMATEIFTGMSQACRAYGLPMLGGHYDPDAKHGALSASVIGKASQLLPGNKMRPGDSILVAIDLRGQRTAKSMYNWDSTLDRRPNSVGEDLFVLAALAETKRVRSCRDIGGAGIVGTISMMAQRSGTGAIIDLEAVPRPVGHEKELWMNVLPSFGFVLAVHSRDIEHVIEAFKTRIIPCAKVGEATIGGVVELEQQGQRAELFDFRKENIFGIE